MLKHESFSAWLERNHPEYELNENWRNAAAGGLAALGSFMGGMQGYAAEPPMPSITQQSVKEINLVKGDPRNPTASLSGPNIIVKFIGSKLFDNTNKIKADQYLKEAEKKLGVKATGLIARTQSNNVWIYTYSTK